MGGNGLDIKNPIEGRAIIEHDRGGELRLIPGAGPVQEDIIITPLGFMATEGWFRVYLKSLREQWEVRCSKPHRQYSFADLMELNEYRKKDG